MKSLFTGLRKNNLNCISPWYSGNGGARGGTHRRLLYHVLTNKLDAHVVAFDYRGFGDSSNVRPSVRGVEKDALYMYRWLIKDRKVDPQRVVVWGHSLGTAITVHFMRHLTPDEQPKAVILEAPFSSISEATAAHPFAAVHRTMGSFCFDYFFVQTIAQDPVTNFDTLSIIHHISTPLLILHAEDDGVHFLSIIFNEKMTFIV